MIEYICDLSRFALRAILFICSHIYSFHPVRIQANKRHERYIFTMWLHFTALKCIHTFNIGKHFHRIPRCLNVVNYDTLSHFPAWLFTAIPFTQIHLYSKMYRPLLSANCHIASKRVAHSFVVSYWNFQTFSMETKHFLGTFRNEFIMRNDSKCRFVIWQTHSHAHTQAIHSQPENNDANNESKTLMLTKKHKMYSKYDNVRLAAHLPVFVHSTVLWHHSNAYPRFRALV